jgi:hypothetical protein
LCLHKAQHPEIHHPPRLLNYLKGHCCQLERKAAWRRVISLEKLNYAWLLFIVLSYVPEDGRKRRNVCEVSNYIHFWYMTAYSGGCIISYERKDVFLISWITFLSFQSSGTSVAFCQQFLKHTEFGSDQNTTINNTVLSSGVRRSNFPTI